MKLFFGKFNREPFLFLLRYKSQWTSRVCFENIIKLRNDSSATTSRREVKNILEKENFQSRNLHFLRGCWEWNYLENPQLNLNSRLLSLVSKDDHEDIRGFFFLNFSTHAHAREHFPESSENFLSFIISVKESLVNLRQLRICFQHEKISGVLLHRALKV